MRLTTTSENGPRSSMRGFTLLELAVVLFIMGLVLALAMPYFGGLNSAELRSDSRRLASLTNYLYQESGSQKVILRLTFDFNNNGYYVTRLDPTALKPVFMREPGPAGIPARMSSGIRIRDVWIANAGTFQRGVAACQFYPGGVVDATVIHLVDHKRRVFTIAIDPYSGRPAVLSGDYSPAAIAEAPR